MTRPQLQPCVNSLLLALAAASLPQVVAATPVALADSPVAKPSPQQLEWMDLEVSAMIGFNLQTICVPVRRLRSLSLACSCCHRRFRPAFRLASAAHRASLLLARTGEQPEQDEPALPGLLEDRGRAVRAQPRRHRSVEPRGARHG